jgi:N6-adenosine-specific RNA methylase IME4
VRYRTIVADPPWDYGEGFVNGPARGVGWSNGKPLPYQPMTVEAIADLPVEQWAHPGGAFVFLWTTNRYLPDAFDVLAAWGFRYRQTLVWAKGDASPFAGAVAPNSAEYLLVGRRGGARREGTWPSSVIAANRGDHSAKPDVFGDLIEAVSPGPYLELFARRQRLGWDTWGDEALEHVTLVRCPTGVACTGCRYCEAAREESEACG